MRAVLLSLAALPISIGSAFAADDASGGGGLPQLNPETYASQLFWLVFTFLILYFLCAKIFLPRLGGIIEERRSRIADDFDEASEFKRQAEQAEAAYMKALADAKARAAQIASETRAQIDTEIGELQAETDRQLEQELSEAEARIERTSAAASAAVRDAAKDTTKALVAALIDEVPSDDAVESALTRAA